MKWRAAAAAASAAATAVASAASSAAGERRASMGSPSRVDGSTRRAAGAAAEHSFAPRFDGLRFIETLVTAHR